MLMMLVPTPRIWARGRHGLCSPCDRARAERSLSGVGAIKRVPCSSCDQARAEWRRILLASTRAIERVRGGVGVSPVLCSCLGSCACTDEVREASSSGGVEFGRHRGCHVRWCAVRVRWALCGAEPRPCAIGEAACTAPRGSLCERGVGAFSKHLCPFVRACFVCRDRRNNVSSADRLFPSLPVLAARYGGRSRRWLSVLSARYGGHALR